MLIKGLDTIEFGLYFDNYNLNFKPYLEIFQHLKIQAQQTGIEKEIRLNDLTIKIHRSGAQFYSYRISSNDFIIWLKDQNLHEHPPVKVRFLSSFLWSFGFAECISSFLNWFSVFNAEIKETKLTRLDICADTDEGKFIESDLSGIVTKAKSKTLHNVDDHYYDGKRFSGFTIGRGNPMLARIYNKTLEIKKTKKTWFNDIWENAGWNKDKDVWRVEFQLRREVLKEFGLLTLDDVLPKESELWIALTQNWLTIRSPKGGNVSRWPVKRKWKIIQKAYLNQDKSPLVRQKVIIGSSIQLLDQINGLSISLAAINDHRDITETLAVIKSWIDLKLQKKATNFEVETEHRKKRFINTT